MISDACRTERGRTILHGRGIQDRYRDAVGAKGVRSRAILPRQPVLTAAMTLTDSGTLQDTDTAELAVDTPEPVADTDTAAGGPADTEPVAGTARVVGIDTAAEEPADTVGSAAGTSEGVPATAMTLPLIRKPVGPGIGPGPGHTRTAVGPVEGNR